MGVSPSEVNVNKYAALSYWENDDEDEDDEDQDEHQELKTRKTKAPGSSPPLKKIKLETDQYYQGEDIFDKMLQEFKDLDAEIALSAIEARKVPLWKDKKNGFITQAIPEPEELPENNDTITVSTDTAENIESSEAIGTFEEKEKYYIDRPNPKIVEESNKIFELPNATLWDYEAQDLPKIYNLNYPVSTQVLAFHQDEIENARQDCSDCTPWLSLIHI